MVFASANRACGPNPISPEVLAWLDPGSTPPDGVRHS